MTKPIPREELLQAKLAGKLKELPPIMQEAFDMSDDMELETEKVFFGAGPQSTDKEAIQKFFEVLANGP